jgi:hypothetical protein
VAASNKGDGSSTDNAVADGIPVTQPSERAQAQLFAKILRREIATMKKKLTNAESAWQHRCESGGYVDPPQRLVVVRQRVAEATNMVDALNARFPRR